MAVPAISYVTAGARLLATYQNSIKDYLDYLLNPPGCQVYRTVAGSLATATWSAGIGLDAEDFDRDGMHNPVTNNSRVTIQTAGRYRITARHSWAASSTGTRTLMVRLNAAGSDSGGTELFRGTTAGSAVVYTSHDATSTVNLGSGDYIEYFAWQNSGGSLSYQVGSPRQCSLECILEGTN